MKNPSQFRSLVVLPLLNAMTNPEVQIPALAEKLQIRKSFLTEVLNAQRPASLEFYQRVASCLNMEISLVPKHLVRSALIETKPIEGVEQIMPHSKAEKGLRTQMKILRNHRIDAGLSVEEVGQSIGNSMGSFIDYQRGFSEGKFPGVDTIQRYADLLNLALVSVHKGSVYADNKMTDYAKAVSYKIKTDSELEVVSIDHVVSDLIENIRQKPDEFSARFRHLTEVSDRFKDLSPKEPKLPKMVYMPKSYAAKLQSLMEQARDKGLERIPYAQFVKPWGDPKSWAKHEVVDMFSEFYRSMERLGLKHADNQVASAICGFADRKRDASMRDMFSILKSGDLALTCRIPALKTTIAIHDPAEMSHIIHQLTADRPIGAIEKTTKLTRQTIESLVAHPEDNRMSSAFRLLRHFGIEVSVQPKALVLDLENQRSLEKDVSIMSL